MIRCISHFAISVVSCLLGISCLRVAEANPPGDFSFDQDRFAKDAPGQVAAFKKPGFSSVTLNKQVEERFAALKQAADAAGFEFFR